MAASVRALRRLHAVRELKRAKAAARRVRFPRGFKGAVLWCPLCQDELLRIPEGVTITQADQQQIADAHRGQCKAVS